MTAAESALERDLSGIPCGAGAKPEILKLRRRAPCSTRQGDVSGELYLLLDGVLVVEVDGKKSAEVEPGAVLGERALLEQGVRTSSPDGEDEVQGRRPARRPARPGPACRSRRQPSPGGPGTRLRRLTPAFDHESTTPTSGGLASNTMAVADNWAEPDSRALTSKDALTWYSVVHPRHPEHTHRH